MADRPRLVLLVASLGIHGCSVEAGPVEEHEATPPSAETPRTPGRAARSPVPVLCQSYAARTLPRKPYVYPIGPTKSGEVLTWRGAARFIYDPVTLRLREASLRAQANFAGVLADGTFFFAGRMTGGMGGRTSFANADRYDPSTDAMVPTAPMHHSRSAASAVQLRDGRVLVVGGMTGSWDKRWMGPPAPAEVYDPAADEWRDTEPSAIGRIDQTAVLLGDGRVLVVGGRHGDRPMADAEVYDPQTNRFRVVAPMRSPRSAAVALAAPDGSAYVFGSATEARGERFDPATETWSWTAPAPRPLNLPTLNSAAWLPCGGWIFGAEWLADGHVAAPSSLLIFEPGRDRWTAVPYRGGPPIAVVPSPIGALVFPRRDAERSDDGAVHVVAP